MAKKSIGDTSVISQIEEMFKISKGRKPKFEEYHRDEDRLQITRLWFLAHQIAQELGGEVKYASDDIENYYIVMENSISYYIQYARERGKINITSGIFRSGYGSGCNWHHKSVDALRRNGEVVTSIGVGIDRGPVLIAREINRRLASDAERVLENAVVMERKHIEAVKKMDALQSRVMRELRGAKLRESDSSDPNSRGLWVNGPFGSVHLMSYVDSEAIRFELIGGVDVDLAIEFINKVTARRLKEEQANNDE